MRVENGGEKQYSLKVNQNYHQNNLSKRNGLLLLILLVGSVTLSAGELSLDHGGVSVDFREFKQIDKIIPAKSTLLRNGSFEENNGKLPTASWAGGWIPSFYGPKEFDSLGICRISTSDSAEGKYCLELGMADEHATKIGKSPFSVNIIATLAEASEPGTKFILTFRYKAEFSKVGGRFGVETPPTPGYTWFQESREWKEAKVEFTSPKSGNFRIVFRFFGYGRAFIDDVKLMVDKAAGSVTMAVLPFSFIDDTFALPSGQVGILNLSARNSAKRKFKKPCIVLTLPEEIRILGLRNSQSLLSQRPVEREGKKYIEYRIAYCTPERIGSDLYEALFGSEFILLQTFLPFGESLYPAECYLSDEDFQGEIRKFKFKVIAPVHGKQPKLFETGTHVYRDFEYSDSAACRALAEFYRQTGFNVIQKMGSNMPQMSVALKAAGIYRYFQFFMENGYTVTSLNLPDEVKYRGVDASQVSRGICPVAIYRKDRYFMETVMPALRKVIVEMDLADSLMCNWEPECVYQNNGCFCDKCREEFIKYSKLPKEEVAVVWPKDVVRKYAKVWSNFRSWQHAQLIMTLEETIAGIGNSTGKKSHFVPEIGRAYLADGPRSQSDPRDYQEKLPVLEAWGPYLFHCYTRTYNYKLGNHLSMYQAAMESIAFLEKNIAVPGNRPALIAFPQGIAGGHMNGILEPEAIAFETLCFFISGWKGSIAYFFPQGFDGRYFQAMAEANTLIADHEEIVIKGKRQETKKRFDIQPLSPLPQMKLWFESNLVEQSLLQCQEYVYGDRRLFAIGNFWQHGDVWIKIIPRDLPLEGKFVLREMSRNRCFTGESGVPFLTVAELRKGITVHVGALRWGFFTLDPWYSNVDYGEKVMPIEVETCLEKYRAKLNKIVETEQALSVKQQRKQGPPDLSKFTVMTAGKTSCRLEKQTNGIGQSVVFTVPDGKLVINPAEGARITSWQYRDIELVASNTVGLGLAVDSFMLPENTLIKGAYQFMEQSQDETSMSITFGKELAVEDFGNKVGGLTLRKRYTILNDGSGFSVSTSLRNDSDHDSTFAFRYHNMPGVIIGSQPKAWRAIMPGMNNKEQILDLGSVQLFRCKPLDAKLEAYRTDKQFAIASPPSVTIDSPQDKFSMTITFTSLDSLYGILFWGFSHDGRMQSTLEPLFDEIRLPQGQVWTTGMNWNITKQKASIGN